MARTKEITTDTYVARVAQSEFRHAKRVTEIRRAALYDESLPDLDRATFGLTGSTEKLEHYRKLGERVIEHIGEPIIVIKDTAGGKVKRASGGIVAGPVKVVFGSPLRSLSGEEKTIDSANLRVPITFPTTFALHSSQTYRNQDEEHIYQDAETSMRERGSDKYYIDIISLNPNYRMPKDELGERQVYESPAGEILIGRSAIYSCDRFTLGVSRLLQVIEESATQKV